MTRRRARASGEDSIYRDGDRWRGAVSLGYDEHGNRVRKKVSGRTRAEVNEKLRKLLQQVDSGVIPDDRLTVQAFPDRWLAVNLPGTVAESTEDGYVDTVRLHLIPAAYRQVVWPRLPSRILAPLPGRVVRQRAGAKSSGRCCRRASNWSPIT